MLLGVSVSLKARSHEQLVVRLVGRHCVIQSIERIVSCCFQETMRPVGWETLCHPINRTTNRSCKRAFTREITVTVILRDAFYLFQKQFPSSRECKIVCQNSRQRPVCGSDGQTHESKCEIRKLRKCEGKNVRLKHRGRCKSKCQDPPGPPPGVASVAKAV